MNIQDVNNAPNPVQNNPVQANIERDIQEEQNPAQNIENRENNRDNFTRSAAAERLHELTGRRQELEEELTALEQNPDQNEPEPERGAELRGELTGIEREMRNIAQPEQEAVNRRQREAINRYAEQNQEVIRERTANRRVMNLFGE